MPLVKDQVHLRQAGVFQAEAAPTTMVPGETGVGSAHLQRRDDLLRRMAGVGSHDLRRDCRIEHGLSDPAQAQEPHDGSARPDALDERLPEVPGEHVETTAFG